jgi:hypothetical protein
MEVKLARTAGFCMGVRRAVDIVLEMAQHETGRHIYTFGPLIHSPQTIELLKSRGITPVKSLEEITDYQNSILIIRAHGISPQERKNKLQTVVSGKDIPGALYIHQDAYLSLGDFEKGTSFSYRIEEPENRGVYLFVIDGSVSFNGEYLFKRDAAEISGLKEINIHADENSRILLIDIPL